MRARTARRTVPGESAVPPALLFNSFGHVGPCCQAMAAGGAVRAGPSKPLLDGV